MATFTTTGASVKVGATPQVSGTTANNFTSPVTYTVTAADASTQAYVVTVTVAANSAKAITAFSFQGLSPAVTGTINEAAHTIALTVPFGTNVTALVATFTTTGASVKVGATLQVSGTTANNFTSPVTYTVTAADASTQAYSVTVTVALNSAKAITAFSFQGLSPAVTGIINEAAHTIALTVPSAPTSPRWWRPSPRPERRSMVAATPQVSGTTANNFTNPVTYTVTAADASTQAYVVTVTVAASSAKAITAFSFQGLSPAVTGIINEAAHTIALTVPFGTNVTALVATFTTTGASVKVGATPQVSGTTANNFTSPVTYTVTAADASTQAYVVTVTVNPGPTPVFTGSVTTSATSITLGESFTITSTVRNDGSTTVWGEIAISFPALNDPADGSRVTGPAGGGPGGSPWHSEYPTGSPITFRDCTMVSSDYLLTTYSDNNWTQGEATTTTLTVTPRSSGQFEILTRAIFQIGTSGCVYANAVPPNGTDAVDETNWPAKRLTVTVNPPPGACCSYPFPQGGPWSCAIRTQAECPTYGNQVWMGAGTDCDPFPCGPTGACCTWVFHNTGFWVCEIRTQEACPTNQNQMWKGAGTVCDPFPCGPTGACCNTATGICTITTAPACAAPLVWRGAVRPATLRPARPHRSAPAWWWSSTHVPQPPTFECHVTTRPTAGIWGRVERRISL